ncbi:AI-2E family transporter [Chelativorans sp. SCAU2101]|jgi:Predicted permease|uniref:AI-2E family transporter n=1 Tax=Chelativorans petroleitrophicus TaxID=2975484 RepID=A0A9X3B059_9HYPH|nr:AI-2E family transporter [Chelativorans petroleitrophicus]MCT8990829.1 AI-2E family transporter [Chelativorans petroleitrophicus]
MSTPAPQRDKAEQAPLHVPIRQLAFWLLATALLILFLYVFSSILLPFLAGMVLAYFLDPVADRLQRLGFSRLAATIVILVGFLLVLTLALMVIIPALSNQLVEFAARLPDYLSRLQALITRLDPGFLEDTVGVDSRTLQEGLNTLLAQGTGFVATLFRSVWSSGLALLNLASLFVVTPVVAFYMLLDWDNMVETVDGWVPRDHLDTVRQIARDINMATAGFVRGQGTLCLILGVYYAAGLTLIGLNFGLLIGLFAGLISFIPFVGSLVGLALSLGVAVVQFWPEWYWVAGVAAIFFSGQFVEGNILQPWLMGKSVGLHPVWLMFSLFAFGYLFGFVGLLIAVPSAAAIAVLVRFALSRYLSSPLYSGHRPPPRKAGES